MNLNLNFPLVFLPEHEQDDTSSLEFGSSESGDGLGTVSSRSRWSLTQPNEGSLTFESEPEREDNDEETRGSDPGSDEILQEQVSRTYKAEHRFSIRQ